MNGCIRQCGTLGRLLDRAGRRRGQGSRWRGSNRSLRGGDCTLWTSVMSVCMLIDCDRLSEPHEQAPLVLLC
jgi:hypothetical protein